VLQKAIRWKDTINTTFAISVKFLFCVTGIFIKSILGLKSNIVPQALGNQTEDR
jgi:uncharacterized membrane protein